MKNSTEKKSKILSILKILFLIFYKITKIFLIIFVIGFILWWQSHKPSNLRDWEVQDAILPTFSWSGETVNITNIRNHQWTSETNFSPNYLSGSYNINDIVGVDYMIIPFASIRGPAHTMLSFAFKDGRHLVISAEIRKERWENFSVIGGMLNQYEIQYVVATEDDVVKLRTNFRKNPVIRYPIRADIADIQGVFRSMIIRSEKLAKEPEFYNTLFNNCTTSILGHANAFRNKENKINWSYLMFLPENTDKILFAENMVDTDLPIDEARKFFNISKRWQVWKEWENFSEVIRK